MNCVRQNTSEIFNQYYIGDYFNYPNIGNKSGCIQACISDPKCIAWKFDYMNRQCQLSHALKGNYVRTKDYKGVESGLVVCKKEYSLAWVITIITIVGIILILFYLMLRHK